MHDYARTYGLRTVVFRMSCIYGPRQFGTEDQGWVAHFMLAVASGRPLTIHGNGKQVRDLLFVDDLVRAFRLPALEELEGRWRAPLAQALYCGVDPSVYRPVFTDPRYQCALSYLGTYAVDRQPAVEEMLFAPARARPSQRFFLAGAQYPPMDLPPNVIHAIHVYQRDHAALYCSSQATLNLTRQSMRKYGWSPSTRIFEAAACGACIISDTWPGLDSIFKPGEEVLLAHDRQDVLCHLDALSSAPSSGRSARRRE